MPSKKRKDGTFKDTAHPLNTETREKIESAVLAEYRGELERTGAPPPDVGDRKLDSSAATEGADEPDPPPDEDNGTGTDTQGE